MEILNRVRGLLRRQQAYEPLEGGSVENVEHTLRSAKKTGFSYVEYGIFLLLGVSMLWAWNMFLAAGPYFQERFRGNGWIFENFQAAEISVSTVTNLGSMLILTRMQAHASYPKRVVSSLIINMVIFSLLAASTILLPDVSAGAYFGFLMVSIFFTSLATGLCQNGIFAYVAGFGAPTYTQGIMTGQAVAGVLPCIAQIVSVLSFQGRFDRSHQPPPKDIARPPPGPPPVRPSAALAYFLTATVITVISLLAFMFLAARNTKPKKLEDNTVLDSGDEPRDREEVPLLALLRKLFWLASAVFITFGVTMIFPIFTQRIVSVRPPEEQPQILQPASFIPLAFLFWNSGDLLGRLITAVPSLSLTQRPRTVFGLALARVSFIALYHLCNIRGQGAVVKSDLFYLVVVQLLFGLTNGYLGSTCMIGAGEWVNPEEREASGGFMGLCLVAGLTVGSLVSFFAAGA